MPQQTDIEWTDFSSNPLKLRLKTTQKLVNACVPCSPGCKLCYAGRIVGRWWPKEEGDYPGYSAQLLKLGDFVMNENELQHMLTFRPKPPFKHRGSRPRVFVCDMTDLFGDWVPFELIDQLFAVFALRPDVDWQVLTKRPERMAKYFADEGDRDKRIYKAAQILSGNGHVRVTRGDNVWLGASVENQDWANNRIWHLLQCPAVVRFLSCQPLLGPIDLANIRHADGERVTDALRGETHYLPTTCIDNTFRRIDWVIVGGESGGGARACNVEWVRSIVKQCSDTGVACFVKQLGALPVFATVEDMHKLCADEFKGCRLDAPAPYFAWLKLKDRKGGTVGEWPEALRVRQMPETAGVSV
jgi:protein gp37